MPEIGWSSPYEAPISLDAARVLGSRPMRATLWTLLGVGASLPVAGLGLMALALATVVAHNNEALAHNVNTLLVLAIPPTIIIWFACMVFSADFGQRPAEYWFKAWARHRTLPKRMEDSSLKKHHSALLDVPRGCIEIVGTTNLRMADDATLASTIKRLGVFFNGLRFPIQIVVRAWPREDGLIERRWLIAFTAPTDALLKSNTQTLVDGLKRAGLRGHALNGDLYDTLQRCWTNAPAHAEQIGPHKVEREARYVVVDGEYVRGFMMARYPRVVDANWLAPLLDGDEPFDFSMWLDPTDNATERDYLASRIVEWQTAQVLNSNQGYPPNPDIDDQITDAKRTRLLLQRRELRVFRASVGFIVRGTTLSEMSERESLLRDQLRECVGDEALIPLDFEHDKAPLLVVPSGTPAIEYPLRTVTPAVARGYPFSNSSVAQPGGVDVGTSVGSKRTNKLNLFSVASPHMIVLGTTGAGKGFWVKVFLWRLLRAQAEMTVYVIQAEKDEYSALAESLGPERAQIVRIQSLEDLTDQWRLPVNWPQVTNQNGVSRARVSGIHEAKAPLTRTRTGALQTFRQLQLFDLTRLPSRQRGQAIAFLLDAIEKSFTQLPPTRNGLVVIDELGIVMESEEAGLAIETAYRRFRSIPTAQNSRQVNRLGMVGISQRPSDLLGHPRGKILPDLALTHVYFRQKSTELKRVASSLGLSEDEQRFLDEECDEGTGLLVADRARVGFHLSATDFETSLART